MTTKNDPNLVKKRERRNREEEILRAAARLFGEHGFRGATLAAVAEAVGLTEPGVLHYFPSKEHLLQGVLDYRDQNDVEKYAPLLENRNRDLAESFKLIEDVVAKNEQTPELVRLFTVLVSESVRSDHPSHDFFVKRYERIRNTLTTQFYESDNINISPDINRDELAAMIIAVMDGLQIQWLLEPEKVNMLATFKLFSKVVVAYLQIRNDNETV